MVDSGSCDELGIQNYFGELADLVDGKFALNHSAQLRMYQFR